jgi:hypothetical protein
LPQMSVPGRNRQRPETFAPRRAEMDAADSLGRRHVSDPRL